MNTVGENTGALLQGFRAKITATMGLIPFAEEAVAAYYCAMDPDTPMYVKTAIVAALIYFVVPTDAIPDVLLGFGYTDDAAVFWAMWQTVSHHVTERHLESARRFFEQPAA